MQKQPCVYIVTNKPNGTLYIGVTSDIVKRIWQHKQKTYGGFTAKYNLQQLVYFELHDAMTTAITREKQIKKWYRQWKIELIEKDNPTWRDLYEDIV